MRLAGKSPLPPVELRPQKLLPAQPRSQTDPGSSFVDTRLEPARSKAIEDSDYPSSFPKAYEVPEPPSTECSEEEMSLVKKFLPEFGDDMYTVFDSEYGE